MEPAILFHGADSVHKHMIGKFILEKSRLVEEGGPLLRLEIPPPS